MNVQRKPSADMLRVNEEFPSDFPKLTAPWDRDDLAKWQAKMDQWWFDFRGVLKRHNEAFARKLSDQDGTEEVVSIQQGLVELQARLTEIQGELADNEDAELLRDLIRAFDNHVLDTAAHGITTPEPQVEAPSFHIQPSLIQSTETVTVPVGHHLVTAGAFAVDGKLVVDGHFVNL